MAFSTQKEFFHVPFMNEVEEFDCLESCVKLKSYPSNIDDRSWSASQEKKSRFVADLIACNSPVIGKRTENGNALKKSVPTSLGPEEEYGSSLLLRDSLINTADDTIRRMQDIMFKNNMLQQKLDESDDKLIVANEENAEILRILSERYNPDKSELLKKKIKELADEKKIDPEDEKQLNDLQMSIVDMIKAHDILEAENSNLKRLIEKQSVRCTLDSIEVDPEKSTDLQYLQNKINRMGKELVLLRKTEDDLMKKCAKLSEIEKSNDIERSNFSPEKDVSNIQRILAERDALRKKCKNLESLGDKINQLEQKANEAENISGDLEDNLNQQSQYINEMQLEMQDMQNYYENEVDKAKGNEEILKRSIQPKAFDGGRSKTVSWLAQ
ncbi:laminin subunit beta-1-like [Drosophila ananassae]|uniref:laminin subunit beta-1-like n=1 Tax=Drosophila ananassae TaxID=7217 RepID=UPI0013A5D34A|nr:laminin subunit beta-1-like [Drosophila ananassae]